MGNRPFFVGAAPIERILAAFRNIYGDGPLCYKWKRYLFARDGFHTSASELTRNMSEPSSEPGKIEAEAARASGNRLRRRMVFLLLVIAGIAAALYSVWQGSGRVVTDDAYVHSTIYVVSPRVAGMVQKVLVEDNQIVEPGELLVQLDPEPPSLQVRMARASVEAGRTQYEGAQVGLKAAQAEDALVDAKLAQARIDLDRATNLFEKKAIAEERYDQALTQHRVLSAQRAVTLAQIDVARSRLESGWAALESAQAQLAHAELLLSYTEIRSPGKGLVSKKEVEEGKVVQPGVPLLAVADLNDLWVDANFKETQLEHVRPGLRAEVRTDAFDSRVFPGRVDSIEAGTGAAFSLFPPENATGNWVKVVQRIPVKVLLDDPSAAGDGLGLRVGMSTEVTILLEGRPLLPWPLSILLR